MTNKIIFNIWKINTKNWINKKNNSNKNERITKEN